MHKNKDFTETSEKKDCIDCDHLRKLGWGYCNNCGKKLR